MNNIGVCPSCGSSYRITEEFCNRKIACKHCGTNVELTLNNENKAVLSAKDPVEEIAPDDAYLLMGKLAVKYKFATIEQIKQALILKEQKKQAGQYLLLGQILVSQGILSQSQLFFLHSVQKLLQTRESDNLFAVFAVKNAFVTQKQVDSALVEQKKIFKTSKTVCPLEDILVESGALEAGQRDAILTRLKGLPEGSIAKKDSTETTQQQQPDDQKALFELNVSKDRLCAFIQPKHALPDSITVQNIKAFLQNQKIQYGLADDSEIAAYLENINNYNQPWQIARGQPPEPGSDAVIKYFFETDPLNIEEIRADHLIDFADIKDIPAVKKGALLAEKTPAQKGSPGMDVYGHPVPAPEPDDKKLRPGKGSTVSEDAFKILACIDGIPSLSVQGKVSVLPRHEIAEDVGLKTGHVDFNGHVQVAGSVRNGYCLKGYSLKAGEILKAEVETAADIVTPGGILGAKIYSGGNIRATFVREADIKAFGDIIVKKGIRDSQIETSGACIIKEGTILSSTIIAQKGIWAGTIGSDISKPCKLVVGADVRVSNELDKLSALVCAKNKEQHKFEHLKNELYQKSKTAENKIGELAQQQDRAMVEQRNVQADIEKLKAAGDDVQLAAAETAFQELDAGVQKMEKHMEDLFELQDQIADKITTIDQNINSIETDVLELEDKITEIREWSSNGSSVSEVKVKDDVFSDTTIDGIHASLSLKRKFNNVLIKEHKVKDADYQMKISPLN